MCEQIQLLNKYSNKLVNVNDYKFIFNIDEVVKNVENTLLYYNINIV